MRIKIDILSFLLFFLVKRFMCTALPLKLPVYMETASIFKADYPVIGRVHISTTEGAREYSRTAFQLYITIILVTQL